MAPKRLLVVSDEMEIGGSQRQITLLLQGLDRSLWEPELAYFRNRSHLVDILLSDGIVVHRIDKRGRIDPRLLWRLARLIRRGRYDVVHAFSLTAELWVLLAMWLANVRTPLVSSVRGMYDDEPAWFWRLKRTILRHSAATIANASRAADVAARLSGTPRRSFDVIANGVELPKPVQVPIGANRNNALRAELQVPPGRLMGLFAGRLVVQKNVECLLRALARIAPDQRPWIAIAGGGDLLGELQRSISRLGIERDTVMLGERSDAEALAACTDFFVLPSSHEGMPNALMEAMAAGCPVVASDVGGIPELVENNVNGLLFPNDDDAALAACLLRLCHDPSLRQRLATAARETVSRRYSTGAMVGATCAVYDRCLEAANTSPASAQPSRRENSGMLGKEG